MDNAPSFICIGSQKAGTSWLYKMLIQNPDAWLPPIKEVHYYDYYYGEHTGTKQWGPAHIKKAMQRICNATYSRPEDIVYAKSLSFQKILTPEWYSSIFNHVDAYTSIVSGEITPEYCSISEEGVRKIKEDLNKPKIIWLIRDPVERAVSQVKMVSHRANLQATCDDWQEILSKVRYKNRANYKRYIPIWDKYFDNDILYVPYGLIGREPLSTIRLIEDFLGINHYEYEGLSNVVHKTKALDVPDDIVMQLSNEMKEQYDFLGERFGSEFLEDVK